MDAHPIFILEFICCQFAACLFFGISLIKYFLFSPLSPWLLTLLPTLTIVCCGKFLLVDFFPAPFSFFFFPICFLFYTVETPISFYQRAMPTAGPHLMSQGKQYCQLQAPKYPESDTVSKTYLNTSGGFYCLCVCSLNKRQINYFCLTKLLGKSLFMLRHENSKAQVCKVRLPVNSNRWYLQKNQYWRTCDSWQHCKGPWVKIEQENSNAQVQ